MIGFRSHNKIVFMEVVEHMCPPDDLNIFAIDDDFCMVILLVLDLSLFFYKK